MKIYGGLAAFMFGVGVVPLIFAVTVAPDAVNIWAACWFIAAVLASASYIESRR